MKNAQGWMFLEHRAKDAVENMRITGMKSALALHLWMGYINHGYSKKYLTKVKNGGNDETSKCSALVTAHETRLKSLANAKDNPGWWVMIKSHRNAVKNGNLNLDKPQKWRSNTV